MDVVLKICDHNSKNAWADLDQTGNEIFRKFLSAAGYKINSKKKKKNGTETRDDEADDERVRVIINQRKLKVSAIADALQLINREMEIDDSLLDCLRCSDCSYSSDDDDDHENNKNNSKENFKNIDLQRLIVLIEMRTRDDNGIEGKLNKMFYFMERKRSFGVTSELVIEWIEDVSAVVKESLRMFDEDENRARRDRRKRRMDSDREEEELDDGDDKEGKSLSILSPEEMKKKHETTQHSIKWMENIAKQKIRTWFQEHQVPMKLNQFQEFCASVIEIWSAEAINSVERAFKDTKSFDSFAERIDNSEALGGGGYSKQQHRGQRLQQNSKNLSIGKIIPAVIPALVETTLKRTLSDESVDRSLTSKTATRKNDLPTSVLSREDSSSSFNLANASHSRENSKIPAFNSQLADAERTITAMIPQQYQHVIQGAFDALGMTRPPRARSQHSLSAFEEKDYNEDGESPALMTDSQKRRHSLKNELYETEQDFIDVEKQQEGDETTWKRLIAFFREVTIRMFLYNVVKLLLIIALLAGDGALCMFVVLRFGIVSGLGVVVVINLGFSAIFIYFMLRFQRREKGVRNMEFGHNWVRQTNTILKGDNAIVNAAVQAQKLEKDIESSGDRIRERINASPILTKSSTAPKKNSRERFVSTHEEF